MSRWLEWVWANLKIGVLSFGGSGRSLLYQEEVVDKKKWIAADEFFEVFTIAQLLPGPNLVNLSAYLSRVFFKNPIVMVLGILALTIPGALIAIGFVSLVNTDRADVALLFKGFSIGSIVLFIVFIARLCRQVLGPDALMRKRLARGFLAISVGALSLIGIPLAWILLYGIVAGIVVEFRL